MCIFFELSVTLYRIYLKEITRQNMCLRICTKELFTLEKTGNKLVSSSEVPLKDEAAVAHP